MTGFFSILIYLCYTGYTLPFYLCQRQSISMASILRKLEVPHPSNEVAPTFLLNHDIRPIEGRRRTWGGAFWLSLNTEISLTIF